MQRPFPNASHEAPRSRDTLFPECRHAGHVSARFGPKARAAAHVEHFESTSHIYTESFNVESKTKGMISGLYEDFLRPKSRARFQTPPSEIVPMHDFVGKCTISCRPSFWEAAYKSVLREVFLMVPVQVPWQVRTRYTDTTYGFQFCPGSCV